MKNARMNISHFRFILFNLKIFGEIVTTFLIWGGGAKRKSHAMTASKNFKGGIFMGQRYRRMECQKLEPVCEVHNHDFAEGEDLQPTDIKFTQNV